jgi:uncharacterized hydrophobic protein (TIGR00271 family)
MKKVRPFLSRFLHFLPQERQQEVLAELAQASRPGFDYFLLVILSCIIATLGLITDSAAVIIGAMLVAPLMSPILGLSVASVAGEQRVFRQSVIALAEGVLLSLMLSAILGWMARWLPFGMLNTLPGEVLARTHPTPFDLGIALAGGAAASYALAQPRLSAALPGVAIATALMPPVCTIGIGVSVNNSSIALGAALMFVTNFSAISFAGILVFAALGFRPRYFDNSWHGLPRSALASAVLVTLVTIPLILLTLNVVRQASRRETISQVVEAEVGKLADTQFVSLDLQDHQPGLDIVVTLRALRQPTYEQTLALQAALANHLQETVALQLIIIPATRLDPLSPPTPTRTRTPGPSLTPTPTLTPSLTPTLTSTATPTATNSPTVTPTATATASPTATFTPTPVLAHIALTGGKGVYLRDAPRGKILRGMADGTQVYILYRREWANGQEWIEVQTLDGLTGWVLAMFLAIHP